MKGLADIEIMRLFEKVPGTLPLYEALSKRIFEAFDSVKIQIGKTQVSFYNRYGFAYISLPIHKRKGWPAVCILLTFGLDHEIKHSRIVQTVEPYPNRWTHHVIVSKLEDIDDELMGWIGQSYNFSLIK